ncbi:MAG: carboxypeptidase regulatory-like domain-containing protein [Anaerolineae bacterium]
MKKFMIPLAILMIAVLAACGGEIDTGAIADQVSEVAEDAGELARDAAQDAADAVGEAVEDAVEVVEEEVSSNQLTIDDVVGAYTIENLDPANDWHYAEITRDGDSLIWTNKADVSWSLTPDFESNLLLTDDSFPYQAEFQNFEIVVENGSYKGLVSNDDLWVPGGESAAAPSATADRWAGSVGEADVTISINGVETQSDGSGRFELYVPSADDGRYVIHADKDGYLPISEIHIGSAIEELTLELQPVETFTIDPTQPIVEEDSRGTQISIEPNSLVDADGNPATEELTMSMYTYDLTTEEMVGDMSGTNTEGELVSMESAGAFYAEFEDESGEEYNLAEGATAEISVPAKEQRPEEVLTVWSYNEETGLWEEEGVAQFDNGRYSAQVSHFSYWNFDWEKREPACIKLDIEPSYLASNTPLNVRAVLQTNPVAVRDLRITQPINVLINLPTNTEVKFYLASDYSSPFATTNSSTPWGGTGIPAYPYDICNGVTKIIPVPEVTTGSIGGQVTNAVTGEPIANAQVCIQGTPKCVNSDASGNYSISDVAPGDQVISAKGDGFIPVSDQTVPVVAGETASRPIALSQELAAGELRIVLEWDQNPGDLDIYLWYPNATNGAVRHDNKNEGSTTLPQLDRDDQDGEGPETITVPIQEAGTYRFAVKHHSGSGSLTTSNAVVRVYKGDTELQSFKAPTTGSGNWWHVFDMNGSDSAITLVDTLSNNEPTQP